MKRSWLYGLLTLLVGTACKQKDVAPFSGCQFSVVIDKYTYTYQYDAQGRPGKLTVQTDAAVPLGSSKSFQYDYTYQGNQLTVEMTYLDMDWLRFRYDMLLTDQGYVATAQQTMFNKLATGTFEERVVTSYACQYDADGYLTRYHQEQFSYPFGLPKVTAPTDATLTYDKGNLLSVSYDSMQSGKQVGVITNQYGTQPNSLKVPFMLEETAGTLTFDDAMQPLMGKPTRLFITSSARKGKTSPSKDQTITFTHPTNLSSQPLRVSRASNFGGLQERVFTTSNCP